MGCMRSKQINQNWNDQSCFVGIPVDQYTMHEKLILVIQPTSSIIQQLNNQKANKNIFSNIFVQKQSNSCKKQKNQQLLFNPQQKPRKFDNKQQKPFNVGANQLTKEKRDIFKKQFEAKNIQKTINQRANQILDCQIICKQQQEQQINQENEQKHEMQIKQHNQAKQKIDLKQRSKNNKSQQQIDFFPQINKKRRNRYKRNRYQEFKNQGQEGYHSCIYNFENEKQIKEAKNRYSIENLKISNQDQIVILSPETYRFTPRIKSLSSLPINEGHKQNNHSEQPNNQQQKQANLHYKEKSKLKFQNTTDSYKLNLKKQNLP